MYRPGKIASILRTLLVFCIVYLPVLAGWIAFKQYYALPIVCTGAEAAALSLDARVDSCHYEKSGVNATFTRQIVTSLGIYPAHTGIMLRDNEYTFNVPITLAMLIVTSLLLRISFRAWSKALAALIMGHLLYVYSCFLYHLQIFRVNIEGRELASTPSLPVQLFWDFCRSMLIRFEPFLILAVLILIHMAGAERKRQSQDYQA